MTDTPEATAPRFEATANLDTNTPTGRKEE